MAKTSIVISMYNARAATIEVVDKLLMPSLINNVNSTKQLILLDDVSPLRTETRAMVERYRQELERRSGDFQFVENQKNLGFSGSYNTGMKRAEGENILIANDDVYFPAQSIDSLISVLENYPNAGAVGPVTNYAYNFQNTQLFRGIKNYSAEELQRIENFASWLKQVMQDRTYESNNGLIGFCLGFKKDTLNDVGYFDERFKYGLYEDTDLNRRIINSGRKVVLDASTFVEHGGPDGGSASIKQHPIRVMKATIENAYRFARKWNDYSAFSLRFVKSALESKGIGTITDDILKEADRKGIQVYSE